MTEELGERLGELATAVCLGAVLVLSGCGGGLKKEPPPDSPLAGRVEVPEPPVGELEAAVEQQLAEARGKLDALLAEASPSPSRLAEAYGELGKTYHAYGFVEAAEPSYDNAVALLPEDFRWRYYRGTLRREEGDFAGASEDLERALQVRPTSLSARIWLAELALRQGDLDRAGQHLDAALKLDNGSATAHFLAGQVAAARGRYEAAVASFREALSLDPKASAIHYPLAQALRRLGDREAAMHHASLRGQRRPAVSDPLLLALRELKSGVRAHLLEGSAAMRAGKVPQAIGSFRAAIAADAENPSAWLNLGAALARSGQHREAVGALETALGLGLDRANRSKAHFNLGILQRMLGDTGAAVDHLREAVRWDEANQQARQQLEQLLALGGRQAS